MQLIARQLKAQMEKKGISTHALEKIAGLRPSAVQNILYGRSKNPNISTLQAIAKALGCPLSDIVNETYPHQTLPQQPQIKKQDEKSGSWDPDFYMKCFESINTLLRKENLSFPKSKVFELVDEVYIYSMGQGSGKVEEYFAEWLIKRSLNDDSRL